VLTEAQAIGSLGEHVAEKWLAERGWTILDKHYRGIRNELDLVMRRDNTVAFVEVKTRRDNSFGDPIAAVDRKKQRMLVRSAKAWVAKNGAPNLEYRFDVIGILVERSGPQILHIENAFTA
jgi:putative endonuclease